MSELDPDELIPEFQRRFATDMPSGICCLAPIGADDCSVIDINGKILVLTSDFVNANPIGLELGISSYSDLGYYLVCSNLSDLAGSGAQPMGLMLNLMWERGRPREHFFQLLDGIESASADFATPVLGGDTKLSGRGTTLNATCLGIVGHPSELILQDRSRVGDRIWVSGPLGSCAAAVIGIDRAFGDAHWRRWAETAVRRPLPPMEKSRRIAALRAWAGGTDLSDGLGADITRLADHSGVGVRIHSGRIPIEPQVTDLARELGVRPEAFALTVGGDLQFLVTMSGHHRQMLALGMTEIGRVVASERTLVTPTGKSVPLPVNGHRDARGLSFVEEIQMLLEHMDLS